MSQAVALDLLHLDFDTIFSILVFCDISSVVSIARTCRYLHNLAFQKRVWVCLLENLRRRSILDYSWTPNIDILSTADMIEIVKRLVAGPEMWNPRHLHCSSGFIGEAITLHRMSFNPPNEAGFFFNRAELLPSGRYVLFLNFSQLECWDVVNDSLLWKHVSDIEHGRILSFAADEQGNGDSLILMFCVYTYVAHAGTRTNYAEIVNVALRTGIRDPLFISLVFSSYAHDLTNPFHGISIRGPLAVVCDNSHFGRCVILNWRDKSHLILHANSRTRYPSDMEVALIDRHIFVRTFTFETGQEIHLISNDALRNRWLRTIGMDRAPLISVADLPRLLSTPISASKEVVVFGMETHDSPLREGNYRVWMHYKYKGVAGLLSYRLTIRGDGFPTWKGPSSNFPVPPTLIRSVPYSGNVFVRNVFDAEEELAVFPPSKPVVSPVLQLKLRASGGGFSVSRYSGALIHTSSSSIVIRYHR
ncbi:hypothetical protein C8R45DRAFT_1082853 [Mycena sanguinolenta]|nr:hypothetical protein C8R45DRAFT_1082853 [Mycena sanguinolenta]